MVKKIDKYAKLPSLSPSGYNFNCGLFAFVLGIQSELLRQPIDTDHHSTKLMTYLNLREFLDYDGSAILANSPITETTMRIAIALRQKLSEALRASKTHNNKQYESFIALAHQILMGQQSAKDEALTVNVTRYLFPHIVSAMKTWEGIVTLLTAANNEINAIREGLFEASKSWPLPANLSNINSQQQITAWKNLLNDAKKQGNSQTLLITMAQFHHEISLLSHNQSLKNQPELLHDCQELYLVNCIDIIKLLKQQNLAQNKQQEASLYYLLAMQPEETKFSNAAYLFLRCHFGDNWPEMYEFYCAHTAEADDMLSYEELTCFARSLDIRLKINNYGDDEENDPSLPKPVMTLHLTNDSNVHWSVVVSEEYREQMLAAPIRYQYEEAPKPLCQSLANDTFSKIFVQRKGQLIEKIQVLYGHIAALNVAPERRAEQEYYMRIFGAYLTLLKSTEFERSPLKEAVEFIKFNENIYGIIYENFSKYSQYYQLLDSLNIIILVSVHFCELMFPDYNFKSNLQETFYELMVEFARISEIAPGSLNHFFALDCPESLPAPAASWILLKNCILSRELLQKHTAQLSKFIAQTSSYNQELDKVSNTLNDYLASIAPPQTTQRIRLATHPALLFSQHDTKGHEAAGNNDITYTMELG